MTTKSPPEDANLTIFLFKDDDTIQSLESPEITQQVNNIHDRVLNGGNSAN